MLKRSLIASSLVLWLFAAITGIVLLARYEATPAMASTTGFPARFPSASSLRPAAESHTLLFFAHPKCPCTRASMRELARLMADINGKLQIYIVFSIPPGAAQDFSETDLRSFAEQLPGARVITDENEVETRLFGAGASGTVLLYDKVGALVFNGGITSARGHEGDNAGRTAIFNIISASNESIDQTEVFGCPLRRSDCDAKTSNSADPSTHAHQ